MNKNIKILLGVLGLGDLAYFIYKKQAKPTQGDNQNAPTPENTNQTTSNTQNTTPQISGSTPKITIPRYPSGVKEGDIISTGFAGSRIFLLKDGKKNSVIGYNKEIQGKPNYVAYNLLNEVPFGDVITYDGKGNLVSVEKVK
jgi:hypothetical protein